MGNNANYTRLTIPTIIKLCTQFKSAPCGIVEEIKMGLAPKETKAQVLVLEVLQLRFSLREYKNIKYKVGSQYGMLSQQSIDHRI